MSTARCDVVPIFPSPRVLAVYTIAERVYTVYTTGVYLGRNEIAAFECRIVDSALCGSALALFTSDSTLAVLSARTLEDARYWGANAEIAAESTGISHFYETLPRSTQMISADLAGSLICVHLGFSTVAVFTYSATSHTLQMLKTVIIEHPFKYFQIVSAGSMPYLWTVKLEAESCYVVELHELASLSFKNTAGHELCHLPLKVPDASGTTKIELFPTGERDGGLLVYAARCLFYIPLSSAIAGDTRRSMHAGVDSAESLFYTQRSATSRAYYVADSDGTVSELVIDAPHKQISLSAHSVSQLPEPALAVQARWFFALPAKGKTISISRGGAKIRQCELDTRKRPWRTLVLSGSHLTAMAPLITVDYVQKAGLDSLSSVLMIVQVPRLKAIFVSTATGTGWLAPHDLEFDGLKNKALLAAGVMSNRLVFIFAEHVELRSTFAPYGIISSWAAGPDDLILDASISAKHCLLRMANKVVSLRPTGSSVDIVEILGGFTVTFVRCDDEKCFIGVATMSEADEFALKQLCPSFTGSNSSSVDGGILCFDDDLTGPSSLQFHSYLPTDIVFLRSGTLVVLYGVDGKVALFPNTQDEAPRIYNVLSSVYVAGRHGQGKQAAILYGRSGLWAVSDEGCRMVCDRKHRRLGDLIQRACVLEDGNIAFVARGELRFLQSPLSYVNQLPSQLQSASNIAKYTNMLLIPSKRMIIIHGGSVCTFMDSVSFEPLHVSGLRAQHCDAVVLWQFDVAGESYEHLVFSNGKAAIESYSIDRHDKEVTLTCKLRFLVASESEYALQREVLYCHEQLVYLARHDHVLKTSPMENKRLGRVYFESIVRGVSQHENLLVVSTERYIHVLDATHLRTLASMPTGKNNLCHAAGFVELHGQKMLHILCAREKERLIVLAFDEKKRTLVLGARRLGGLSDQDYRIKSLSRLSSQVTESGFSVLAVMADFSIKRISVTGPADTFGAEIF